MAATKITPKEFVEALKDWSILDVVEAVKAIEDEFGIKAAAPVAVAAVAGPAGGEAAPAEEEQTEFTVTLTAVGDSKINVIKAVRELTQLGLKEAKDLVDAAPKPVLENVAKADAGGVAALEDAVGQVSKPLLDVVDANFQDQLQAGQTRVVAGHRPGPGFQAPGVVGEGELLQRESERVAGREPAGAARPHLGDELGLHIQKGVARPAADPLEAASDERVAAHRLHVQRHAAAGLVTVDHAQRAGGVGGVGDRPHVLQVAGRIEKVGRRDQRGPRVDPLGECLGWDGQAVVRRHELHLILRPAQPLVADGREVQLPDQHFVPALGQGQAGGQGRERHRDGGGDGGRAGRRPEQLGHAAAEALEQRQPGGEPDRRALLVPVLAVPGQGGAAASWKRPEGAGVEVDAAVEEGEFSPQGAPIWHVSQTLATGTGRWYSARKPRPGRDFAWSCLSAPVEGYFVVYSPFVHVPAAHPAF